MYAQDMKTLSDKISANQLEEADELVKKLHAAYNDRPLIHARIHFAWANIARLRKKYLLAVGQMITGFLFAIPVSLFKKLKSS